MKGLKDDEILSILLLVSSDFASCQGKLLLEKFLNSVALCIPWQEIPVFIILEPTTDYIQNRHFFPHICNKIDPVVNAGTP